jgi:hypothetical protein
MLKGMLSIVFALLLAFVFAYNLALAKGTIGMIIAGKTSLPPGQYVLTNLNSGNSLYVEINRRGDLKAQEPSKLQISVAPNNGSGPIPFFGDDSPSNYNANQFNGYNPGTPGTVPGANSNPQSGSMWGGLLRKGMDNFMNQGQTGATPNF